MKISILIHTYQLIKQVLPHSYKKSPIVLILFSIIKALLDVLGIALVLPAMILVLKQDQLNSLPGFMVLPSIWAICLFVLLLLLLKTVLSFIASRIQMHIVSGIIRDVSVSKLSFFLNDTYTAQKQKHTAEQVNIVTNIPFDFATSILIPYVNLVTEVVVLSAIVLALFFYKPILCLFLILILGPFILIYRLVMRRRLDYFNKTHQEASRYYHFLASEILHSYTDIKLSGTISYFRNKFAKIAGEVVKPYASFNVMNDMVSKITELVAITGLCVMIFLTDIFHYSHSQILEFLSVFILGLSRLLPSVNRILFYVNNIDSSQFAIDNLKPEVNKLLGIENQITHTSINFSDKIVMSNISVKYGVKTILNDISLEINKGDVIGISGASGVGKSTLIYLLLGLISPNEGTITIDGTNITQENADMWYKQVGYVPQHVTILDGSVTENIAFGVQTKEIDQNRLIRAATLAGVNTFLTGLPNQWETRLGENGFNISGGQRQRIAIARCLYNNPEIVIFDEATNALDMDAEEELLQTINNIQKKYTVIIIAHRPSALRFCNRRYVVTNGKLELATNV